MELTQINSFACILTIVYFAFSNSEETKNLPDCSKETIEQIRGQSIQILKTKNFTDPAWQKFAPFREPDYSQFEYFRNFLIFLDRTSSNCRISTDVNANIAMALISFYVCMEYYPYYFGIETHLNFQALTGCSRDNLAPCLGNFDRILPVLKDLLGNANLWENLRVYTNLSRDSMIDCSKFVNSTIITQYEPSVWLRRKAPQFLLDCIRANPIDPLVPPLPPFSAIKTTFNLVPQALISLNNDGELSLFSTIAVIWADTRRMWNTTQLPDSTRLHSHEIWHPRLWLDRSFTESTLIEPGNSSYVNLSHIGIADYRLVRKIDVICDLELDDFPFDEQTCAIRVFTTDLDVQLAPLPFDIETRNPDFPTSEWEFLNSSFRSSVITIANNMGAPIKFSAYEFILKVKRNPEYYMQSLILPVILISILGAFYLLLSPQEDDKLNFAVTIFLGFIFVQTIVAAVIPTDAGIPKIGKYVIIVLVQSAVNLAGVTIVMAIQKIDRPRFPPFLITLIFIRIIGIVVLVDIKNTIRFWKARTFQKSRNSRLDVRPQIRLESRGESTSKGAHGGASSHAGESHLLAKEETEVGTENEQSVEKARDEKSKGSWKKIACVIDRFVGLAYCIVAIANFFYYLFPLFFR